jgi:endo-1,4-beta-xylanase
MKFLMKFFIYLLFLAVGVFSQNLVKNGDMEYGEGSWNVWTSPEGGGRCSWEVDKGFGTEGSIGLRVSIEKIGKLDWHIQAQAPRWLAEKGKWYRLSYKVRSEGGGKVHTAIQGGPPSWEYVSGKTVEPGTEWQTEGFKFQAHSQGFGQVRIHFYLQKKATYFLDDLVIQEIPAPDSLWYQNAEARIDSIRKSEVELRFLDAKGDPVSDTEVEVILKKHHFGFGTALNFNEHPYLEWYKEKAAELFWEGVIENDFKWPEYERREGELNRDRILEYQEFAKERGWKFRGHALAWPIEKYGYENHWARKDCETYKGALKNRITRELKEYAQLFSEYDVWNEPLHERAILERCGEGILDSAFHWAHRADSSALLYINDYGIISGEETDNFVNFIQKKLKAGVPIHGVGVQGHFFSEGMNPALVKEKLDKLGALGLKLKITELDMGSYDRGRQSSDEEQADFYEKMIRTAFSHPAVDGLLLWGFWDDKHWLQKGGIIDRAREERPAWKRIQKLWDDWSTHLKLTTDEEGKVNYCGFKGQYLVKMGKSSFAFSAENEKTKEVFTVSPH